MEPKYYLMLDQNNRPSALIEINEGKVKNLATAYPGIPEGLKQISAKDAEKYKEEIEEYLIERMEAKKKSIEEMVKREVRHLLLERGIEIPEVLKNSKKEE